VVLANGESYADATTCNMLHLSGAAVHPLDTACSPRVVAGHACKQRNFVQNGVDFAALCHDDDANVRGASWCTTLTYPVGIRRPSAAGSFDAVRARHMSKVHDATIGRPLHDRTPSPTAHDPHDHNAHACEERRKSTRAMQWTCLGVRGGGVSCVTSANMRERAERQRTGCQCRGHCTRQKRWEAAKRRWT
jgi:hypothetical protein